MIEFVPLSDVGRRFSEEFVVRLGDADSAGNLRPDGVARFLQDVATDDWDDTGIEASETWVVRRTALRIAHSGRWPRFKERLTLTTWCGGYGAAWAERRTDISASGILLLQAVAIWVPIDPSGHPVRIRPNFFDVYGEQIRLRKVSGRVGKSIVAENAVMRPWPLRRADLDIVGHVNNAAVWQAVSEVVSAPAREIIVTHYGPVENGHEVTLATAPGALWLLVDGTVRVAVEIVS